MEIGISLGSNQGDRLENLRRACRELQAIPGFLLLAKSPVYETEPVGVAPAFRDLRFLNAVVIAQWSRPAGELLRECHRIEEGMGRRRGADRYAPRPIDLDLIYAGDRPLRTPELELPHPRWAERRFVVQPLCDVRPDWTPPGGAQTVRALLAALATRPGVELFGTEW